MLKQLIDELTFQVRIAQMLLCSLWRRRNDKLWENMVVSDSSVVQRGDDFLQAWVNAKMKSNSGQLQTDQHPVQR